MNTRITSVLTFTTLCAAFCLAATSFAQETSPAASSPAASTGAPSSADEMAQMMALTKLNENHKLLGELAGNWSYTVKMWMAPGMPPIESKGTAVRKPMMDGRYYKMDAIGQFKMPDETGKMKETEFKGFSLEGYDNAKKKFVSAWIDNMGTGILMSEGTYDAATKTFTYTSEVEMLPGQKVPARETVKVIDKDHHVLEWYETKNGQEMKTMEISYTRKK